METILDNKKIEELKEMQEIKQSKSIICAIKPEYTKKIFSGEKKWEFRRTQPDGLPNKIYIYETAPVSAIVGSVEVENTFFVYWNENHKKKIWNRVKEEAGITQSEFFDYFEGSMWGITYRLKNPFKYEKVIQIKYPIQSWKYVDITAEIKLREMEKQLKEKKA